MDERGIVISNDNGVLKIKILEGDFAICDKCSIKGICNQDAGKERIVFIKSKEKIEAGSHVLLEINELTGIFMASMIFLLPLILFILSFCIFMKFIPEIFSFMLSFLVLTLYYIFLKLIEPFLFKKVKIIKIQ